MRERHCGQAVSGGTGSSPALAVALARHVKTAPYHAVQAAKDQRRSRGRIVPPQTLRMSPTGRPDRTSCASGRSRRDGGRSRMKPAALTGGGPLIVNPPAAPAPRLGCTASRAHGDHGQTAGSAGGRSAAGDTVHAGRLRRPRVPRVPRERPATFRVSRRGRPSGVRRRPARPRRTTRRVPGATSIELGAEMLIGDHDRATMLGYFIGEQSPASKNYRQALLRRFHSCSLNLVTNVDGVLISHAGLSRTFAADFAAVGRDPAGLARLINEEFRHALERQLSLGIDAARAAHSRRTLAAVAARRRHRRGARATPRRYRASPATRRRASFATGARPTSAPPAWASSTRAATASTARRPRHYRYGVVRGGVVSVRPAHPMRQQGRQAAGYPDVLCVWAKSPKRRPVTREAPALTGSGPGLPSRQTRVRLSWMAWQPMQSARGSGSLARAVLGPRIDRNSLQTTM